MKTPGKIDVIDLIPKLDNLLLELLSTLSPEEWNRQTIAPMWMVKDVAVHLLDGNLKTLSMLRDGYYGDKTDGLETYEDLVKYLNDLNAVWVNAAKRFSPKVIIDLLRISGQEYSAFLKTLDPDATATFSVAWAGESESKNWFHIAREYTEKWHHQQQIRHAVGQEEELLRDKWYIPYLDTSIRALPHHYQDVKGIEGDLIKFTFEGVSRKSWFLLYQEGHWRLLTEVNQTPTCEVSIPDAYAWRIFTRGISKEEAIKNSYLHGKQELGMKIFDMLAVMA